MLWLIFFLVVTLFITLNSLAFLPVLCVSNNMLAKRLKRSLFEKASLQIAKFGTLLAILFSITLFADYIMQGKIMEYIIIPKICQYPMLLLCAGLAVLGLLFSLCLKVPKSVRMPLYCLNCVIGSVVFLTNIIITWAFLRSLPLVLDPNTFWTTWTTWQFQNSEQVFFILFILFAFFSGLFFAHLLSLTYFILRRNKDDFGRDYYNLIVNSHSRRASFMGILLFLPLTALIFLVPFSTQKIILIVDNLQALTSMVINKQYISYALGLSNLFFALSVLCIFIMSQAKLPLQKKYLLVFSMFSFLIGLTALFIKLWY